MNTRLVLAAICLAVSAPLAGQTSPVPAPPPAAPAAPDEDGGRIIGGTTVPDGDAPWAVEIRVFGDFSKGQIDDDQTDATLHNGKSLFMTERPDWDVRHFCGAVLIARDWVLTAAHCVLDEGSTTENDAQLVRDFKRTSRLRIGTQDISDGSGALCKPLAVRFPPKGDIALIRIDQTRCTPGTRPAHAVPIRILGTAPADPPRAKFTPQTVFNVFGWGMTKPRSMNAIGVSTTVSLHKYNVRHIDPNSPVLLFAPVGFVPGEVCAKRPDYAPLVSHGLLCAGVASGTKDQCDGDSGGPLTRDRAIDENTIEHVLVGLVHGGDGCGQALTPGTYVYVPDYLPWIERTVGKEQLAPPAAAGNT